MRKMYKLVTALFCVGLFSIGKLSSQVSGLLVYSSPSNTYTEVSGGLSLGTTTSDDQVIVNPTALGGGSVFGTTAIGPGLPLGLNFTIGGNTYDRVGVSANGWLRLGKSGNGVTAINMTNSGNYVPISGSIPGTVAADRAFTIAAFGQDLQAQAGASITLVTDSSSAIRVATIQWKKYKKYSTGGAGDTLNFQIKISDDGSIALSYGNFVRTNTNADIMQVGVRDFTSFINRTTSSNWSNTTAGATNTDGCTFSSTVKPVNGLTFLYAPAAACSGTPNAGNIFTASTGVCVGNIVTITDTGYTQASGITFQWFLNGAPIVGETSATYSDTVTAAGAYYCEVTCSGNTVQTNTITLTINAPSSCYCASAATNTADDDIGNVTIGTLNNGVGTPALSNSTSNKLYTDFTGLAPTILNSPLSYPISITQINSSASFYACFAKVFIDYNQDGIFQDPAEVAYSGQTASGLGNNILNGTVSIPPVAPGVVVTGVTRMRIVLRESGNATTTTACGTYTYGETEDYLVDIQQAPVCSGTPTAGSTVTADSSVCSGTTVNFGLSGNSQASGLTYQWQENGTNILNATNSTYSIALSSPNTYQCVVTCTASGQFSTSTPVTMSINPFNQCYCNTALGSSCTSNGITQVTLPGVGTTLNTTSTCSPSTYTLFPDTGVATTKVYKILSYPLTTKYNGTVKSAVWIDYDHSGTYDASEYTLITNSVAANTPITTNITIPTTALLGKTGMRIRSTATFNALLGANACTNLFSSETEDYTIEIDNAVGCTAVPTAGVISVSDSAVCANEIISFTNTGYTAASGISFQWYLNGVAVAGATSPSFIDTITATGSYYCTVTCSAFPGTPVNTNTINVSLNPATLCYCFPANPASSCPNDKITAVAIVGTTLNNPNNACNVVNNSAYTSYPDTGIATGAFQQGQTIQINVTTNSNNIISVWIDFNQNGLFEATEWKQVSLSSTANTVNTATINVPVNATVGKTGMRVRSRSSGSPNGAGDACTAMFSGETEDYVVEVLAAIPCAGLPVAGSTVANDTTVCLNSVVNLSLSGNGIASGLTYQWQENGVDIPNATNVTLSDTVTGPSVYQCVITCTASGSSSTSTPVTMVVNPFSLCYCAITSTSTFGTDIGNVTVGAFTNGIATPVTGNTAANKVYTNFTNLPPISLLAGIPNNIQMTGITSSTFTGTTINGKVFIDYNQDGTFDPITELVFSGTGTYSTPTGSVISGNPLIPGTAPTGVTGMRVMLYEGTFANPCLAPSFTAGETEDYLVDIQLAVGCTGTPNAGSAQSSDSLVCANNTFNLSLVGAGSGAGISYQWYANGNIIPNDTLPTVSNVTQSATTTYTCVLTCANSSQSSTSVGVTVNSDIPANCLCIPTFSSGCSGDEIISVSVNGNTNNTGTACPASPYYTAFPTPVMSANPGDSTLCIFEHGPVYQHYINVWIDYNDDFVFSDPERVITNLSLPASAGVVGKKFVATSDSGIHKMRVLQNYNTAVVNPQSCGTYGYGETEDYLINISDTVTTYTSLGKVLGKSANFTIQLFPNPTSGILNYTLPANVKNATISVSDLLGRILITKSANSTKSIDLSELKNGNYSITINADGKVFQSKVVLNK
jgi:GEVED domain/Secretion system C-terminal sorting domain